MKGKSSSHANSFQQIFSLGRARGGGGGGGYCKEDKLGWIYTVLSDGTLVSQPTNRPASEQHQCDKLIRRPAITRRCI